MRNGDGLSREKRLERITSPEPFAVIDNSIASLLHQAEAIASFIRYYNMNNEPDGCFDMLLPQLHDWSLLYRQGKLPPSDGTMEPSQALLLTFLHQLHFITEKFNRQWDNLPYWYLNEVLGIENLPARKDKVWISLQSRFRSGLTLEKGTKFLLGTDAGQGSVYCLNELVAVENTTISKAFSVLYNKKKDFYPASALDCVTSVEVCKLLDEKKEQEQMFPDGNNAGCMQSPGFTISSASLLLREGRRNVTIRFESETPALADFIKKIKNVPDSPFVSKTDEGIIYKILEGIFYMQISTPEGWKEIENFHLKNGDGIHCNNLTLKFILPENFPPTSSCLNEIHGIDTKHPSLKLELNYDAWLYPYSWIKDIQLKRIVIDTQVEGISGVLVYNDLGRIDNSKPFVPFGINTERGAWLAVGNYEMATKDTLSIDLNIQWGQLPDEESGLYDYYQEYAADIDNLSFRVKSGYLQDYQWQTDSQRPSMPLFATKGKSVNGMPLKQGKLDKNSILKNIDINRMPAVNLSEELYDYNIRTRNGFACLILEDPPMGFGEKRYRQLFTDQIMKKALRKGGSTMLNPPITPRIEKIMLNYHAEDCIDLRSMPKDERHELRHIFPFGYKKVYPGSGFRIVPLIYSMDYDAHVLLGLENIRGGELLRLYFDFLPMKMEMDLEDYPVLSWHWGDGYIWEPVPDGVIIRDMTRNFFISGEILFGIPENLPNKLCDENGILWLRASVVKGREFIAKLSGIYTNAAELIRDQDEKVAVPGLAKGEIRLMNEIAGLESVKTISAPRREHTAEDDQRKLMRVSEYVTHRGKSVTSRDFERIVLQAFPQVGKVKCLPAFDAKGGRRKGVVTLAVIPRKARSGKGKEWMPKASSDLLLEIEQSMKEHCSAMVSKVDAVNPLYEEVFLRCRVKFRPGYSLGGCRSELWEICNIIIAPWQKKQAMPVFDHHLQLSKFRNVIRKKEFIEELEFLSLVRVAKTGDEAYRVDEYTNDEDIITPSVPYAVFVPANHIFNCGESGAFGIGEMTIGETFIIDRADSGINTTV